MCKREREEEFEGVRGEKYKEEGENIGRIKWMRIDIGHDDIVHVFCGTVFGVRVGRAESQTGGDFSLLKSLDSYRCFKLDVVAVHFPKTIALGFDTHH